MAGQGSVEEVMHSLSYAQKVSSRIKAAGYQLEKPQLKMLLADLTAAIATSKMELSMLQGVCEARDAEILRLHEISLYRGNLRRRGDGYYKTLESGRPYGQPYCSYCWEHESKMLHLHNKVFSKDARVCPHCKNEYQAVRTPFIEAQDVSYN